MRHRGGSIGQGHTLVANEHLADEPPAVRQEINVNTDATNLALQVALLIPILAGLLALLNSRA